MRVYWYLLYACARGGAWQGWTRKNEGERKRERGTKGAKECDRRAESERETERERENAKLETHYALAPPLLFDEAAANRILPDRNRAGARFNLGIAPKYSTVVVPAMRRGASAPRTHAHMPARARDAPLLVLSDVYPSPGSIIRGRSETLRASKLLPVQSYDVIRPLEKPQSSS